jgi:hypothetical protein
MPISIGFVGVLRIILVSRSCSNLYRKVIAPDPNPRPIPIRPHRQRRSAADFPAALFPWRRKDDA